MVYCKRLKNGEKCIINAPADTPKEVFDFLFEIAEGINAKKGKKKIHQKVIYAIFVICAVAFTVFVIGEKTGNRKCDTMADTKILTIEELEKMPNNFLTVSEASRALEISPNTFYRRAETMGIPYKRFGRKYAIPREPFIEYLRSRKICEMRKSEKVITVCYGETKEWSSREEAEKYFFEAMSNSDGSERERYTNVYVRIMQGDTKCTDGCI